MQSFFFANGHDPVRCEKLRKETARLRSQIRQFDSNAPSDVLGGGGAAGGGGHGAGGRRSGPGAKKLGEYCIACELARLFQDMFSAEGMWECCFYCSAIRFFVFDSILVSLVRKSVVVLLIQALPTDAHNPCSQASSSSSARLTSVTTGTRIPPQQLLRHDNTDSRAPRKRNTRPPLFLPFLCALRRFFILLFAYLVARPIFVKM